MLVREEKIMNEDNVWWTRDADDFFYESYDENFLRRLYFEGVRFVCVLKDGTGKVLHEDGSTSTEINIPQDLLEKMWDLEQQ